MERRSKYVPPSEDEMLPVTPSTVARMIAEIEMITENAPEQIHYRNFFKFKDLQVSLQFDEEKDGNSYGVCIYSVDEYDEITNSLTYQVDPIKGEVVKYENEISQDPITAKEMKELIGLLFYLDRRGDMAQVNSLVINGLFHSTEVPYVTEEEGDRLHSSVALAETVEMLARQGQKTIERRLSYPIENKKYTIETSKIEGDTFAKVTIEPKLRGTSDVKEQFIIYRDGKCKHSFDFPHGVRSDRNPEVFQLNRDVFVAYEAEALEFERRRLVPLMRIKRTLS